MKNKFVKTGAMIAMFFLLAAVAVPLMAQCPMCKASAQSNMQNGGSAGSGLNTGILYMLVVPYLLVGSIGYWWWRNRKSEALDASEMSEESASN